MANEFIARKGLIALDNSGISGSLDVSGSLSINGISDVSASIASAAAGGGSDFPYTGSAIISGSLEVIGKITGSILIEGSGSTLFEVNGSEGQLFSITDSLSGSLFAVSDVSGLPILEVFSDDTVKIGTFNNEGLIINGSNVTASNNVNIQGVLSLPGFNNVSASLAAASAGGDNLGNHTATQDLNMGTYAITNVGNVDGVDVSVLNSTVSTNTSNIATLTAATSSYSTATGVENNADVTDFTNVQAAGALMDSEVTSLTLIKGLTAAQISGAFDSVSASLASDIPTNNNQLINGAGYTTNTGTVTSVGGTGTVSGLSLSGTVTTSGNLTLGGTISISSTNITDVDAFSQTGTYASLRAQGTTAEDVGLGNVTNESKATMFTSPTFTGTVAIPGFADVSASLAAAVAGGDNLGNHTATQDLDLGGNDIINIGNITASGNISASGAIIGSDVYINDWGSVSASLAAAGGGTGDNLGNHTATQDLNMNSYPITNVTSITGSNSAAIEIGDYNFGYELTPSLPITGSGIIIRETGLPANNYPMLKIGDVEMLDINSAFSPNVFFIHNVDSIIFASGSEPVDVFGEGPGKLFEHNSDIFKVYSTDNIQLTIDGAGSSFENTVILKSGSLHRTISSNNIKYLGGWDVIPSATPQELYYISTSSIIPDTASYASTATTASYASTATTASYALTASYAENAGQNYSSVVTETASIYIENNSYVGKYVICNSAAAFEVELEDSLTWTPNVGDEIYFFQSGSGQVSLVASGSVVFQSPGSLIATRAQYSTIGIKHLGSDNWAVMGDLG